MGARPIELEDIAFLIIAVDFPVPFPPLLLQLHLGKIHPVKHALRAECKKKLMVVIQAKQEPAQLVATYNAVISKMYSYVYL